jgi:hypothetical protein
VLCNKYYLVLLNQIKEMNIEAIPHTADSNKNKDLQFGLTVDITPKITVKAEKIREKDKFTRLNSD